MGDGTSAGYELGSAEHDLARVDLQGRALAPPPAPSWRWRRSSLACGCWIWAAGREIGRSPLSAWRDGRVVGVDRLKLLRQYELGPLGESSERDAARDAAGPGGCCLPVT